MQTDNAGALLSTSLHSQLGFVGQGEDALQKYLDFLRDTSSMIAALGQIYGTRWMREVGSEGSGRLRVHRTTGLDTIYLQVLNSLILWTKL